MRKLTISLLGFALVSVACGGGGGGGGPSDSNVGDGNQSHGSILPEDPGGLGVAGNLDGLWQVARAELTATPAPKGDPKTSCAFRVGEKLRIEDGKLVAVDGEDPRDPPDSVQQIPVRLDFHASDNAGDIVRFCVGFTLLDNPFFTSGTIQMGLIAGTTTSTTAKARLYCLEQVRGSKLPDFEEIDRFGAWELTLERVSQ